MKKLALITIAVIYGLGQMQLQAQTDTIHYGDSWMWVEPASSKLGKMVSIRKDSTVYGHWATNNKWVIDSVDYFSNYQNYFFGGTPPNIFQGFPYNDTISHTIYGIAIPMRVYDFDTCWPWSLYKTDSVLVNEKNIYGRREGDSGFWAGIARTEPYPYQWETKHLMFEKSVRLGPKLLTDEIDKLIGGTGQIRRSCFIYDFDTTEPEAFRHDTAELLEMYLDEPYEYKAGDTIYASFKHSYIAGYNLATRVIYPYVALYPKLRNSWLRYKRELIGSGRLDTTKVGYTYTVSITEDTALVIPPGRAISPFAFPIVKLHCSTPRDWSMTTAADSAVLTWQHFDGAEGYELMVNNITQCDSSVLLISDPDAVQHTLQGLDSNSYYHVRLRKLCRYATPTYDTIVPSDWTEVFTIGNPTPPCDTTDTTIVDTTIVDTTGIHLAGSLRLELQPNPASDMVELTMDAPDGGRLTLTDLAGREVLQMAIPAPTTTLHLDIHTLPAGAYLLKVSTPNGTATRRLLVQ